MDDIIPGVALGKRISLTLAYGSAWLKIGKIWKATMFGIFRMGNKLKFGSTTGLIRK